MGPVVSANQSTWEPNGTQGRVGAAVTGVAFYGSSFPAPVRALRRNPLDDGMTRDRVPFSLSWQLGMDFVMFWCQCTAPLQ